MSVFYSSFFFSALLNFSIANIAEYRNNFIVSAEFNYIGNNTINANGFYSGIAIHSIPLTTNLLSNSLIKAYGGDEYSISVSRQQLPNTLFSSRLIAPEVESIPRILIFCSFFFPTVAIFVLHPLQETMTKVKQLQRMTGVTSVSYWSTMFAFDFLIYTICALLITLALYVMDIILDIRLYYKIEICKFLLQILLKTDKYIFFVSLYTYFYSTVCTILILELFGINVLLVVYLFSFMNKSRSTIIIILGLVPTGLGKSVVTHLSKILIKFFIYVYLCIFMYIY